MTETHMDLFELLAMQDGGDFLRGVVEPVPQPILEADGNGPIGAGRHEWETRATWRNGYRERALDTRLGTLNLKLPKPRQGNYAPGFPEPRKTSEKAPNWRSAPLARPSRRYRAGVRGHLATLSGALDAQRPGRMSHAAGTASRSPRVRR